LQAKWFNNLSNILCNEVSTSWKNKRGSFDPKVVVQSLTALLREESATQGKQVDDSFFQSLEELQTDPDFNTILTEFDDALKGKRNMMTIGESIGLLLAYRFLLFVSSFFRCARLLAHVVLILSRFVYGNIYFV